MFNKSISLLLLFILVVTSCTNKSNDSYIKNSTLKECPEGCIIDSVKCDWDKSRDWYYKYECVDIKRKDGCGTWSHEFKACDLPDIDLLTGGLSALSLVVGEELEMKAAIEFNSHPFPLNYSTSNFSISFYIKNENGDIVLSKVTDSLHFWNTMQFDGYYDGRTGEYHNYSDRIIILANTSFTFNKHGHYRILFYVDEDNKMIEAKENNNFVEKGIDITPKAGEMQLSLIFNEFKENGSINKTIFNKLKQIIYCDSSLNCTFLENIKIYFKNDVGQILNYLVPNSTFFNLSSKELYYFIKNTTTLNLTYCNQNQSISNKTYEEFYVLQNNNAKHRSTDKSCNLYDIEFLDKTGYDYIPNPELPLLKINSDNITEQIVIDSVLYYNIIDPGLPVLRTSIDNVNYTIYEVGNNYLIHLFTLPLIQHEYTDCRKSLIYYDVFKLNKNDKTLIKLNKGYKEKIIGKCWSEQDKEETRINYPDLFCEKDEDCVAAQCCHPTSTINRKYAPVCGGIVCTGVCSGPLDCGSSQPACIKNKCGIR
ncbi:hypothetical protein HYY70_04595 [Candidatus Woesearchaeota archaeon]|nr:hypothetical protein [Candidatus Woesearchaeota archaeon]